MSEGEVDVFHNEGFKQTQETMYVSIVFGFYARKGRELSP